MEKNEKMFTQQEVNEIIKKRLERDKNKNQQYGSDEEVEALKNQLTQRENRLNAKEYLLDNNIPLDVLNMLDTSDLNAFKENVIKLQDNGFGVKQDVIVQPLADPSINLTDEHKLNFSYHKPKKYLGR